MRRLLIDIVTVTTLYLVTTPAFAEQVMYCADTEVVGFLWDQQGRIRVTSFVPQRFTVKVVSDFERVITSTTGKARYNCRVDGLQGQISCNHGTVDVPWLFYGNTYERAFLAGPPAGGSGRNINVAHGVCTDF